MIFKKDYTDIKSDIGENIGRKIKIKYFVGKNKSFEKEATIEKTYPNIFIVKYNENEQNVSFSYTDVLTKTIELKIFNGEEYTPLISPELQLEFVQKV